MENIFDYPVFNQFRNSEYIQFFGNIASICQDRQPDNLQITVPLNAFTSALASLTQSYKPDSGKDLTASVVSLDVRRDTGMRCLERIVDGYSIHPNPEKQSAGNAILKTIQKYGKNIPRQNYLAETTSLDHLSKDLTTNPTLVAAVALIGVGDIVAEIVDANNAFKAAYRQRINYEAAQTQLAVSEYIPAVIKAYRQLTAHIAAHSILNPSDEYTVLINQINTLIGKYNDTVNLRGKTSSSTDDTPEMPSPTDATSDTSPTTQS